MAQAMEQWSSSWTGRAADNRVAFIEDNELDILGELLNSANMRNCVQEGGYDPSIGLLKPLNRSL
jgi:hypothetical protein